MNQSAEEKELVVHINYEAFVLGLAMLSLVNWVILAWVRSTPSRPGGVDRQCRAEHLSAAGFWPFACGASRTAGDF